MNRIVLIDAKNLCYRAHYAFADLKTEAKEPTSVLYGMPHLFLDVMSYVGKADYVLCWDGAPPHVKAEWVPTWRKAIWPEYKSNRKDSPDRELVRQQLPLVGEFFNKCGFLQLGIVGMEADDVIAFGAQMLRERGREVFIYSNDSDLWQLVAQDIAVVAPSGQGGITVIDSAAVKERYGVEPMYLPGLKALAGDTSDNYKPVAGLGVKGALGMLLDGICPGSPTPPQGTKHDARLAPHWDKINAAFKLALLPPPTEYIAPFEDAIAAEMKRLRKERTRRMSADELKRREDAFSKFLLRWELNDIFRRRKIFFQHVLDPK